MSLASFSLVVANSSLTQLGLSNRGQSKAMSLSLADAGVDDAIDHLRSDHSYAGATSQTLYEDPTTKKTPSGSFTTTVTPIAGDVYHSTITSTGNSANGTSGKVVAAVHYLPTTLGSSALGAGLNININGTANIGTLVPGQHDANMFANGNINATSSANVVDGSISAAGSVSVPQQNLGVSVNLSVNSHSTTTTLPNAQEILALQAQVKAEASPTSGLNVLTASALSLNLKLLGVGVITSPTYIVGDLHLKSGQILTILGTGTVYVEGSVILDSGATLINDTATLAVQGTFTQDANSLYQVVTTGTVGLGTTPTLIVFNNGFTQGTAITMAGSGISLLQGIVYAANGDIQFIGNKTFVGSFLAGGSIIANANLTLLYSDASRSKITYPGDPVVTFWGEG